MKSIGTNQSRAKAGQRGLSCRKATWLVPAASLALMAASGCGGTSSKVIITPPQSKPAQLYFAPTMGDIYASTYTIDHTAMTFARKVYGFDQSPAAGGTITDSGIASKLSNGIVSLGITYNETTSGVITVYNPPLIGSWAVELPGHAALVGMKDATNFTPVVPTLACPSIATPQSFLFLTIPTLLNTAETTIGEGNWSPQLETAYGSVDISTSGTTVQFNNVSQSTLPAFNGGKPGAPSIPAPASTTAACTQSYYGYMIGVPNAVTIINPGENNTPNPPSAAIGIGPSGFLVEDAGTSTVAGEPYVNVLGAGYGAIGLPKPTSALSTSAVASAHYSGFLYGSGGPVNANQSGPGFSLIGSFGYSNLKSSCPTLPAPTTPTILYGGEFANNDPSANASGNCDLAIDLGTQDSSNNGLYPAATVYVTAGFPKNGITTPYSFPAVAIAGAINGKYAIFLLGVDTSGSPSQAWGIYLLQSN